jgi:hypothetical protein
MTNTKDALDAAAREYINQGWLPVEPNNDEYAEVFKAGAEFGANRERERAKGLIENYKWLLGVMRNYLKPDAPLEKGMAPMFYHTLTFEGDQKILDDAQKAIQALAQYEGGE